MSVPDPVTIAVTGGAVLGAINQVAKQAQDYLAAATGHAGESIGTILGNLTRRRWQNAEATLSDAHFTLLNIGVSEQEVPLKIIQPLVEAASLEEEPELRQIWSNLLANAADPRQMNPVHPSFIPMAKELTAREAKLLDALHALVVKNVLAPYHSIEFNDFGLKAAYAEAGLSRQPRIGGLTYGDYEQNGDELRADLKEFAVALGVVMRLGILTENVKTEPIDTAAIVTQLARKMLPSKLKVGSKTTYTFTPFGIQFMNAGREPVKDS